MIVAIPEVSLVPMFVFALLVQNFEIEIWEDIIDFLCLFYITEKEFRNSDLSQLPVFRFNYNANTVTPELENANDVRPT